MQSEGHRWIYLVRSCGYDVSPSDYPLGAHCALEALMASGPESPKGMSAEQNFIHTHDSRWLSTVTIYKSFSYLPSFFDFVDYDACKLHLHVVDEVARGYNDWRKISNRGDRFPNSSIANVVIHHVYGIMRTFIQRDLTIILTVHDSLLGRAHGLWLAYPATDVLPISYLFHRGVIR